MKEGLKKEEAEALQKTLVDGELCCLRFNRVTCDFLGAVGGGGRRCRRRWAVSVAWAGVLHLLGCCAC